MIKKFWKNEKGFTASDGLIAVLIIALFSGLILTISYNIYLSSTSIKRISQANQYIINMFEYIDRKYYDDITITKIKADYPYLEENNNYNNETENNMERIGVLQGTEQEYGRYNVILIIDRFIPEAENSLDLVKQITIKVNYKLGNKDQQIEIKKIKKRESLKVPNIPDLSIIEINENEKAYPIKKVNENYVVCNENEIGWYNYEGNNSAKVGISANLNLKEGDIFTVESNTIYEWIPRYASNR